MSYEKERANFSLFTYGADLDMEVDMRVFPVLVQEIVMDLLKRKEIVQNYQAAKIHQMIQHCSTHVVM